MTRTPAMVRGWEKGYPPGLRWAFNVPGGALHRLFDNAARRRGDAVCVDFMGREITYREMAALVRRFASGLQQLGVRKGDRVGICLPNSPYFVAAYYGILKAGAVIVNMSPLLTADELAAEVRDSGAVAVVTVDLAKIYPKVMAAAKGSAVKHVIVADFTAALPLVKEWLFKIFKHRELAAVDGATTVTWDAVLSDKPLRRVVVDPAKDLALLQYTGGTTGTPKAAMLTHANLMANTQQVRVWMGPAKREGEVFMVVLPLFHVFAMTSCLNLGIAVGAKLVLLPMFSMGMLLGAIQRTRPTIMPGVPTLFGAITAAKGVEKRDLRSIRWCVSGGAALPAEVKAKFEAMTGCVLVEGYGLTEASPVVTCNPRSGGGPEASIGLPLPGTEIEVRSLYNVRKPVKPGKRGEIVVRGPQVMAGYWNRPDETVKVLIDGWLRTGDVGYMDERGYVFLTDRLKDIIISNGYNVYPRVIEEVMYTNPAVAEVTAIAIPHPHKGEAAKIFVRLAEGAVASEADLLAFARARLNPIECPVAAEIRDSLPKTATGKLSKKELLAEEKRKRENVR